MAFVIDQGETNRCYNIDIRHHNGLEEGHLEAVGIVGVIDMEHPSEPLPRFLAPGVGPEETCHLVGVRCTVSNRVLDAFVFETLDKGLGWRVTTNSLLVVLLAQIIEVFINRQLRQS